MKKNFNKLHSLMALFITFAMFSSNVFADVPDSPRDLEAGTDYWDSNGGIFLTWNHNEQDDLEYFIYRAEGKTEDLSKFEKLQSRDYSIFPLDFEFGMIAYVSHAFGKTYSYYVTAANEEGESGKSNIISMKIYNPNERIQFTTFPKNLQAEIGMEWKYDANAKSGLKDAKILYDLVEAPESAEIDEESGELTWTPIEGGVYNFIIKAYLEDDVDLFEKQQFAIKVNICDELAKIEGEVSDMFGNEIKIGIASIYTKDNSGNVIFLENKRFENGKYSFDVDKGIYTLEIDGFSNKNSIIYKKEFWNNAKSLEDATWIEIDCDEDFTADFELEEFDYEKEQVKIISTPSEIAKINEEYSYQVEVAYEGSSEVYYSIIESSDESASITEDGLFTWTPTKNGRYFFTVMAQTDDFNQNADFQNFVVNILLCENPATISGTLTNADGTPISDGIAMIFDSEDMQNNFAYFTEVIDGSYKFENVDKGSYYLYFQGHDKINRKEYIPEFWNDAKNIDEAELISVDCDADLTFDAVLDEIPDEGIYVNITSEPSLNAEINQEWTYDVDAESNMDNAKIIYSFAEAPKGAEIDSETGVISWTPTKFGAFRFAIFAELSNYDRIYDVQEFTIFIRECEESSTIKGIVKDENGNVIENAFVILVYGEFGDDDDLIGIQIADYRDTENGEYNFEGLDKGTYYLYAEGYGKIDREHFYYGEWFDDKFDFMEANPIELNCDEIREVNFELEKYIEPNYYTVSGNVSGEETDQVIPNIVIEFIGIDPKNRSQNSFITISDENGNYSIELPDNHSFIARAAGHNYKFEDDDNWLSYLPEYYNNVSDISEATEIILTGDLNNINFTLEEMPVYENSITGNVVNESGESLTPSFVVAYLVSPEDDDDYIKQYYGRAVETDSEGFFEITNLIPGEYVLMAHPIDKSYVPGYYREDDIAVRSWENATRISVEESGESGEYSIILELHKKVNGKGKVRGAVGKKGKVAKITDEVASNDALAGAMIYITNSNGNVVKSIQTDNMGEFSANGLAAGEYTLSADKIGYFTGSASFIIEGDEEIETNINLDTKTTSVDEIYDVIAAKVFPNPTNTNFTVEFETEISGNSDLEIVNVLGEVVYTTKVNLNDGYNSIPVSINDQANGTYFVKISNNIGTIAITPIIISK